MNESLNRKIIKFIFVILLFTICSSQSFLIASEKNINRDLNDKIKTRGAGGKVKFNFNKKSKIFELNRKKIKKSFNYTKLLSASLSKQPKRIQTRGSG